MYGVESPWEWSTISSNIVQPHTVHCNRCNVPDTDSWMIIILLSFHGGLISKAWSHRFYQWQCKRKNITLRGHRIHNQETHASEMPLWGTLHSITNNSPFLTCRILFSNSLLITSSTMQGSCYAPVMSASAISGSQSHTARLASYWSCGIRVHMAVRKEDDDSSMAWMSVKPIKFSIKRMECDGVS